MINKKTVQLSVVLNERVYDDVKKLAIKKRTSMGNIIRSFIIKGLNVENHDENEEEFRRMIHDEMTEVFKQEVERLIKLQVKSQRQVQSRCIQDYRLCRSLLRMMSALHVL